MGGTAGKPHHGREVVRERGPHVEDRKHSQDDIDRNLWYVRRINTGMLHKHASSTTGHGLNYALWLLDSVSKAAFASAHREYNKTPFL